MVKIAKTRNGGTWTESQYFSAIRSALRQKFRFFVPLQAAKQNARRKYTGENKQQKWEYLCSTCSNWFKEKEIEIHHKIPCGSIKSLEDIAGFIERLTCEDVNGYEVMCKNCHNQETQSNKK